MCISVSYTTNTSARLSFFEDKRSGLDSLLLGCMVVQYIGKDSNAGRDWGQEEKGTTEDEMAGWHHRLDGREFE